MIDVLTAQTTTHIQPVNHTYVGVCAPSGKTVVVGVHESMLVEVIVKLEEAGYTNVLPLIERSQELAVEAYQQRLLKVKNA